MKKIEEIIEMMKSVNPDIKMDYTFKKSLKNKLEVTSYAKLKNTKNKKVNIAKSGFFSLKKTNKNIFEKPKINFLKILSPIFAGAFAVFGFFNFYGNNLFITDKGGDFNYKIEKISEDKNDSLIISSSPKEDEKNNLENIEKQEIKKIINKKIIKINKERKIKIIKNKVKEEDDFTKKILSEMQANDDIIENENIDKKQENKNTKRDFILESKEIIPQANENNVNTEIIDILGNEESTENMEINYGNDFEDDNSIVQDSGVSAEIFIPEISEFEDFCNSKNGKILNNICTYGELKCSLEDFQNNKCDKN